VLRDLAQYRPPVIDMPAIRNHLQVRRRASMRARISFWKPFITDSTTIRAITPSAMPSMEISEMKEMKWLRRLARV